MNNSLFISLLGYLLTINFQASAATKSVFPVGQTMAMVIIHTPSMGPADQDAERLYSAMNVEPKDSFIGPGKTIKFGEKIMSLVCAIRGGSNYTCTLVLHGSEVTKISPENKTAKFSLTGTNAENLFKLFKPKDGEESLSYKTTDGTLIIKATKQEFFISYQN